MLPRGRLFYKKVDSIPKTLNLNVRLTHDRTSREIVIPKKIERGPTDILKALASTVAVDPTAFPYKYPDDPYFYTYNVSAKRVFAMAMESGRKSAKWVFENNPGFFKHQLADPPIQAFLRKEEKVNDKELTEEDLLNDINERNVLEAVKTYETLKTKQIEIANSTKQSLLELVCFYNGKERPELDQEEKWYKDYMGRAGVGAVKEEKWNEHGFAESLFQEMDSNCPLANSAIIQGRLKYGEVKSALELINVLRDSGIKLSVATYNMLLSESQHILKNKNEVADFVLKKPARDGLTDTRRDFLCLMWKYPEAAVTTNVERDFILGNLNEMAEKNIKPNLGTLNAALKALSDTGSTLAGKLIKEFLRLGIEPSLGSYGYLFRILGKTSAAERSNHKPLILKILDHIENQELKVLHPCDVRFFNEAMDAFVEGFIDADLALRLADVYFKRNNRQLIVTGHGEHIFFKQLLFIVFKKKPFDFAMDLYRRYIFTIHTPDSKTISMMLRKLNENYHPEYLPAIWEDFGKLGYTKNRPILGRMLDLIKDYTDEKSLKVFHEVALSFVEKLKDYKSGDEDYFPNLILAFLKNDDEAKVVELVNVIKEKNLLFVNLADDFLESLFGYAMSKENVLLIRECLRLSDENGFSGTSEMAERALPLLSGVNEAWAKSLMQKYEKKTNPEKTKSEAPLSDRSPDAE